MTPSECVALGLLIEDEERPKAVERQRAGQFSGPLIRDGKTEPDHVVGSGGPLGGVREIVARAVGMGSERYSQAKAVVFAAKEEPERFGDLVALMDQTGKVGPAFRLLERRRRGNGRSAVHRGAPFPKPNEGMQRGLALLEGIRAAFESLEVEQLDPARRPEWAQTLKRTASFLARFAARVKGDHGETPERGSAQ